MSSIKGKKLFKPGSERKTKLNNWLWHPWQEDLKSIICDKCRIFIYFFIFLIQQHGSHAKAFLMDLSLDFN